MEATKCFIRTDKETPADAEIISHQLLLRSGFIKKLSSGIYSYMPLGIRVLRKIENIIRQELDSAGASEILMPAIQPASLWQETDRWDNMGLELLKISDRHKRNFCFGPTHEEVITDIIRKEVSSYKQLPVTLYQIQSKFRDEIRPRFGVMRAREFIMKDAYSFHTNDESLEDSYQIMYEAYCKIFHNIGLKFRAVLADSGNIGGKISHEFHVLADSGEDTIAYCDNSDYAANVELATTMTPLASQVTDGPKITKIHTPGKTSIEAISKLLNIPAEKTIKTIIVEGSEHPIVACMISGDHSISETKLAKNPIVKTPIKLASEQQIQQYLKMEPGFLGPVNLNIPIITDHFAAALDDFICGANEADYHFQHAHWNRDCEPGNICDIREVTTGDQSPDNKGKLLLTKGIEVGHIFQLGTKYSKSMNATALDENGESFPLIMGCYGIGVSRLLAAAIEQNHDDKGMIWPEAIAPFHIHLIPMNYYKSQAIQDYTNNIYNTLKQHGIETLLDNRNLRAGSLFADADLIGIPHQVIIGEKSMSVNKVEYKNRNSGEKSLLSIEELINIVG